MYLEQKKEKNLNNIFTAISIDFGRNVAEVRYLNFFVRLKIVLSEKCLQS
jgi:hypothetical protein